MKARKSDWRFQSPLAILAFLAPLGACAATLNGSPGNYLSLLPSLAPGDTLQLTSGTYTGGLPISSMNGTASLPIIIAGPSDQSARFTADDCCNTIELRNASYIEIHNLTLDGSGTVDAFGVNSSGPTHHITIAHLKIVNYGADQQAVGIGTKAPAWNWIVRDNTIIGAGTGMYFGNSDGTQPFVAGIIENNLVLDTIGYNVQIKHQLARPTGLGMPTGANVTVIRNNVFSKRNNAATGGSARPNLLVGHFPVSGTGSNDRYEIYGNFFYENPTEALFQGEGNIALYDNLLVNSYDDAVNIQPQNDVPRNVTVLHNTVVAAGGGIRVSGAASGYTQAIVGNASFAATPVSGPNQADNITGSFAGAATYLNDPTGAVGALDLYPKSGQLLGAAISLAPFATLTDYNKDFNGTLRTGIHRGAYEGSGVNPGWKLALAMKESARSGSGPAPIVSLIAAPAEVVSGGTVSLTWSSTDATECAASGGWSGSRMTSGSTSSGSITSTTVFTLTCSGPGGSSSKSVAVSLIAAPMITFTSSPDSVTAGGSTTLSWNVSGASSCTASGGWSGSKTTSGAEVTGALQASTSFTLACSGSGGTTTQTVTVQVSSASGGGGDGGSGGGGSLGLLEVILVGWQVLGLQRSRSRSA